MFTVHFHILQCLQSVSWRIFRSWDTHFAAINVLIPHCHVIWWPPHDIYSVRGTRIVRHTQQVTQPITVVFLDQHWSCSNKASTSVQDTVPERKSWKKGNEHISELKNWLFGARPRRLVIPAESCRITCTIVSRLIIDRWLRNISQWEDKQFSVYSPTTK